MSDERVDEAEKPIVETPASTAAEKAFENEGGPSPVGSRRARTARASDPIMDRIERSAGRIKARLTAKGR